MKPEDFEQLIGVFLAEIQDFLTALEENLLTLEQTQAANVRLECIKQLFRAAHSIKGSASMFGFEGFSAAAHALEDAFAALRDRADLSQLSPATISALLNGVDHLRAIADLLTASPQEDDSVTEHWQTIVQIKADIEVLYGKPAPPTSELTAAAINLSLIQGIFEQELPPVLDRLEAELSQAQSAALSPTIEIISEIHYQLSGMATMLQLSEFAALADQLDRLVQLPDLTVEQLQQHGWAIAQNLRSAREQILQDVPLTVQPIAFFATDTDDSCAGEPVTPPEAVQDLTGPTPDLITLSTASSTLPIIPGVSSEPQSWQRPTIRVDVERLTELVNLIGELVINRTNLQLQEGQLRTELKRIRQGVTSLTHASGELREEYDRMSVVHGPSLQTAAHHASPYQRDRNFDTLEMDRYTAFHSTAQSILDTTQAIAHSANKVDDLALKFERSTEHLRRVTDQLRHRVMQLRVVSFSRAVDHLPRALRDLGRLHNKSVNLLLLGRETKIDESLLDALRDPLIHLVRNAFDHGIESPEERQLVGKPPTGQIEIEARHQGGQTVITITDDGRGLDPDLIRRKLVERELVTAEQVRSLSISELYDFLFWPGFSTRDQATDLSGRGVGLDVVRTNLRQVRGTVKVDSRPGKGTSFILKLPLVLSITEALMVKVDHHILAVPIDAVEEIINIQADQIHRAGSQPMLLWREEFIRFARLQDLVQYAPSPWDVASPTPVQDHMPVLLLEANGSVLAIAVDRLLGQQEIVVKPIPTPLSKPKGIVGSTILGDGQVVPILDVDDLISEFAPQQSTAVAMDEHHSPTLAPVPLTQPQILIVDDSYTIRHLLALSLSRARYRVVQAKDGQDAAEKLQEGLHCDLIISDLEMPRMNGFEFLQFLKSDSRFKAIPVAVLTSRSGTKHRQTAMNLGANTYFTKPYSEPQFLAAIAQLLSTH